MSAVSFTIPGVPQQQGSKVFSRNGYGYEANKNLKPWRATALTVIREAKGDTDGPVFTGPVQVTMVAFFPRPKAHYGTGGNSGVVKASAPSWHSSAPDADKLARALGDALTQAGLILDDRLIVAWDISKVYGDPRMEVTVCDAAPIVWEAPAVVEEQEVLL